MSRQAVVDRRQIALLTVACLFPAGTTTRGEPVHRPPNIILFLVDDWGWTDAGCYGNTFYETPHIDRLAAEGMKFTQAYAACTVCSPTRAAFMTGKYPARLHLTDFIPGMNRPFAKLKVPEWTKQLPHGERTLAEELKSRGYATGLFGKWHLGDASDRPEFHGFDVNFGGCHRGAPSSYFPPYGIPVITDEIPGEFLSDRITREAVRFIRAHRAGPFFLFLSHYAVHEPIAAPAALVEKYRKKLASGRYDQSEATYAALIENTDASLGAIVRTLEELGLADNTIVLVTSDNGGFSGLAHSQGWRPGPTRSDPLRYGKGSAYEGGVRVPLVIKWPGATTPGSANSIPVISMDLFPTMLDMVTEGEPNRKAATSASQPPPLDGVSLVGLLRGDSDLQRDAIYWHYPHYVSSTNRPYTAFRDGDWQLVHTYTDDQFRFFNVAADPEQKRDLASEQPHKAAELRAQLETWRNAGKGTPCSAIRTGDWKLIHFFEDNRVELYDLKSDLGERHDVSSLNRNKAAALLARLDAWRTEIGAQIPTKNPEYDPARAWEYTPAQKLRP